MAEIQTYPAMNENIAWLLRMTKDSPVSIYAAARIEELEAERDALRALLSEWLHEGRFLVANTPEKDDLVRRTRAALAEGRQPMREGGARDAESA